MKFKVLVAIGSLLASTSLVQAKTFSLPEKGPMVTLDVPDSWHPQSDGKAMEGTSEDGKLFLRADIVPAKNIEDATVGAVKWLETKGVHITDKMPIKDMQANGMKGFNLQMSGTDSIGPAQVSVSVFASKDAQRFVMITLWGDEVIEEHNLDDLDHIIASLKLTK